MTPQPSMSRTTPRTGNGPMPGPAVPRWVMALAVLAGFVAMHGLSSDHGVHTLAGSAGHHSPASPMAPADALHRASDVTLELAGSAPVDLMSEAGLALWTGAGDTGGGQADVGCLLMLTASVLALVLAAMGLRRTGFRLSTSSPRAHHVLPSRGPPRRTAPGLFALGVLRT